MPTSRLKSKSLQPQPWSAANMTSSIGYVIQVIHTHYASAKPLPITFAKSPTPLKVPQKEVISFFFMSKKIILKVFNRKYLYWLIFAYCLRGKITPCYTNALITLLASTTYLSLLCNPKINLLLVCRNPLISPHPSLAINNNTYLLSGSQRTCKHTKTHYEYSSFL